MRASCTVGRGRVGPAPAALNIRSIIRGRLRVRLAGGGRYHRIRRLPVIDPITPALRVRPGPAADFFIHSLRCVPPVSSQPVSSPLVARGRRGPPRRQVAAASRWHGGGQGPGDLTTSPAHGLALAPKTTRRDRTGGQARLRRQAALLPTCRRASTPAGGARPGRVALSRARIPDSAARAGACARTTARRGCDGSS